MKYPGQPALAVAGSCGSMELEEGQRAFRKQMLSKDKKGVAHSEAKKGVAHSEAKKEGVAKKSLPIPEPVTRSSVSDFVAQHLRK